MALISAGLLLRRKRSCNMTPIQIVVTVLPSRWAPCLRVSRPFCFSRKTGSPGGRAVSGRALPPAMMGASRVCLKSVSCNCHRTACPNLSHRLTVLCTCGTERTFEHWRGNSVYICWCSSCLYNAHRNPSPVSLDKTSPIPTIRLLELSARDERAKFR